VSSITLKVMNGFDFREILIIGSLLTREQFAKFGKVGIRVTC